MANTLTIDSFAPLSVQRPTRVAELCELVKHTRAAKRAIYPVGGRTSLDIGLTPTKPGIAVDTTAMNAIIDYPARDMTITANAGITFAAVQAQLAKEGQWLPIDVPLPEKTTLGGAVAISACGPRRYGYGTLRDYVIGISFVTDDGTEVKAGGRVVKNVAGYDMMKLQIGALGTLGVTTQLTLKVKPKPEAAATVVFGCDSASLAPILDCLAGSKTRPVAVEVTNSATWRTAKLTPASAADWIVVVCFEEKAAAVNWQTATLLEELKPFAVRDVAIVNDTAILNTFTAWQLRTESRWIGKQSVLPSQVATTLATAKAEFVHAHALTGVIWLHDSDSLPPDAVLRRAPNNQKRPNRLWGKPPASWELMRHIKRTLDPDNVFNPGRLFGID